ncbi:hypothetical protein RPMA_18170 [Tardiphaga alba]|uniref:Uncharacterized protein n=1 Tax=Tardiphaga alba TaxID=340268 RepID=A0ABX8A9V3_9BRAD|nr:hypothetical protein [Tardiphaga alba]QUS40544.1 hypothetical protein RPMA_18170 [Tardiphaga alba]
MKSTQATRDRVRELMSKEMDDYDRAVECVLDDLEGLLSGAPAAPPCGRMREALEFIRDGYERGDINHVDYRVGAYKAALDALGDGSSSDGSGVRLEESARSHGESLQQGPDTPTTASDSWDGGNVAKPVAAPDRASRVVPGPSEAQHSAASSANPVVADYATTETTSPEIPDNSPEPKRKLTAEEGEMLRQALLDSTLPAYDISPEPDAVREALEAARTEIVCAIAFLGRDAGTDRIEGTIAGLIKRLVAADQAARAALSRPAHGGWEEALRRIRDFPHSCSPCEQAMAQIARDALARKECAPALDVSHFLCPGCGNDMRNPAEPHKADCEFIAFVKAKKTSAAPSDAVSGKESSNG